MQTVEVTDHTRIPLRRLLNPIWMMQSTGDETMSWRAPEINNGVAYLPNIENQMLRNIIWWFRNPAGNFVGFVVGLDGVNYIVTGSDNVLATTGRDCRPQVIGWRWAVLRTRLLAYPFVNYWGPTWGWWRKLTGMPMVEFYCGWRPASGGLGIKLVFPAAGQFNRVFDR